MTAHELAAILLAGPDLAICISEYAGGDDEVREAQAVVLTDTYQGGPKDTLLLQTYKEVA